jgi:hypothetical protein
MSYVVKAEHVLVYNLMCCCCVIMLLMMMVMVMVLVMQISEDCFNMDFKHPLSMLQAFAIAVSRYVSLCMCVCGTVIHCTLYNMMYCTVIHCNVI